MEKLEQIIDLLKSLSDEDIVKLKSAIKTDETNETTEKTIEEENSGNESKGNLNAETEENTEESAQDDATDSKNAEEENVLISDTESETDTNNSIETKEDLPNEKENIPKMQKGNSYGEEDYLEEPEEEQDDAVDYTQVIEAQKARIEALEQENASLKNKVDGAFGFSAKPSTAIKTNRLYDDCSDIHFKR